MKAAIYARLSEVDVDAEGRVAQQANLDQQVARGRAEAERRGWDVVDAYVEPGRSGFKEVGRPQLERLLADVATGKVEVVIVRHVDRLYRDLARAAAFRSVCDVVAYDQGVDTTTGDPLPFDIHAVLAAAESRTKSRRTKAWRERMAADGRRVVGGVRKLGYEPDQVTARPAEVRLIREGAAAVARGASLRSVVRTWRSARLGLDRVSPITVKRCLLRAAEYGVDPDVARRVASILTDPARRSNGTGANRKHGVLTGLVRCSCGGKMYTVRKERARIPYYRCHIDSGGCGNVFIQAANLDSWLVGKIYQLDRVICDRVDVSDPSAEEAELRDRRAALDAREANKRLDYARDLIDAETLRVALADVRAERDVVDRRLAELAKERAAREPLDAAAVAALESDWDFDRARLVVSTYVESVTVQPSGNRPDVPVWERAKVAWRGSVADWVESA